MMFALRQMMLATPMMTATPSDVCLTAHWANIASLRNEVEQHHFERSEKHHIATGDGSLIYMLSRCTECKKTVKTVSEANKKWK